MVTFSPVSDDIVEDCLERLRQRQTIEDCLRAYPTLAHELEPLLQLAVQAHTLPAPQLRPEVRTRIRRQMLQAVQQRSRPPKQRSWFASPFMRVALACGALFFAMGSGLAAAQTSLPHSPLYVVKRMSEDMRLQFATDPTERAALQLQYSEVRFHELEELATAGIPIPDSVLADCTEQHDLAWQALVQLAPETAAPLYQRYLESAEQRITVLSGDTLAGVAHPDALARFTEHEQAALDSAEQDPLANTRETPPSQVPTATGPEPTPAHGRPGSAGDHPATPRMSPTIPALPVDTANAAATPLPDDTANATALPSEPTASPEPKDNGNHGQPTQPPEEPTTSPEPKDHGNHGQPTAQPGNGNQGNNGGERNSDEPTTQPSPSDDPTPQPKETPEKQEQNEGNGKNKNPPSQPGQDNKGGNGKGNTP